MSLDLCLGLERVRGFRGKFGHISCSFRATPLVLSAQSSKHANYVTPHCVIFTHRCDVCVTRNYIYVSSHVPLSLCRCCFYCLRSHSLLFYSSYSSAVLCCSAAYKAVKVHYSSFVSSPNTACFLTNLIFANTAM